MSDPDPKRAARFEFVRAQDLARMRRELRAIREARALVLAPLVEPPADEQPGRPS